MKIFKRFVNILFVIFFALLPGMVYAIKGEVLHIAAPDVCSKDRYYIAERRSPEKFYIEEKNGSTCRKNHGAFVERVRLGEYIVYDDSAFSEEFTHAIRAIDSDNYIVGLQYPQGEITPILKITRESVRSPWRIKSCHILGRVCLPSPEVYIEETLCSESRVVKSAVTTPDIKSGQVYNCVTPLGALDEFTDIISFCAAFLFK